MPTKNAVIDHVTAATDAETAGIAIAIEIVATGGTEIEITHIMIITAQIGDIGLIGAADIIAAEVMIGLGITATAGHIGHAAPIHPTDGITHPIAAVLALALISEAADTILIAGPRPRIVSTVRPMGHITAIKARLSAGA